MNDYSTTIATAILVIIMFIVAGLYSALYNDYKCHSMISGYAFQFQSYSFITKQCFAKTLNGSIVEMNHYRVLN